MAKPFRVHVARSFRRRLGNLENFFGSENPRVSDGNVWEVRPSRLNFRDIFEWAEDDSDAKRRIKIRCLATRLGALLVKFSQLRVSRQRDQDIPEK